MIARGLLPACVSRYVRIALIGLAIGSILVGMMHGHTALYTVTWTH